MVVRGVALIVLSATPLQVILAATETVTIVVDRQMFVVIQTVLLIAALLVREAIVVPHLPLLTEGGLGGVGAAVVP